jgi:hypothetical protein
MKTARRYQGPGRSQTRLQSSALLQSNAVRLIELLTAPKSVSMTLEDDEEQMTSRSSRIAQEESNRRANKQRVSKKCSKCLYTNWLTG